MSRENNPNGKPVKSWYQIQELAMKWSNLADDKITHTDILQWGKEGRFDIHCCNTGLKKALLGMKPKLGVPDRKIEAYLESEYLRLKDHQLLQLICGKPVEISMVSVDECDFVQGEEPFDKEDIDIAVIVENERITIEPTDIETLFIKKAEVSSFESEHFRGGDFNEKYQKKVGRSFWNDTSQDQEFEIAFDAHSNPNLNEIGISESQLQEIIDKKVSPNASGVEKQNAIAEIASCTAQAMKYYKLADNILNNPLSVMPDTPQQKDRVMRYVWLHELEAEKNRVAKTPWCSARDIKIKEIDEKMAEINRQLGRAVDDGQFNNLNEPENNHDSGCNKNELAHTTWLRNTWIKEGRPDGADFFARLKKHKGANGSPIHDWYMYGNKGKGPGITLQTKTRTINITRNRIQKIVSGFKKEEKESATKNLSSKNQ